MPPAVVTDTGPIIHLDEADALSLLSVFDAIHVPETVIRELEDGSVPTGLDDLDPEIHDVTVSDDPYPDLDPGETVALHLADRTETILLTDDLDAREVAADLDIEVHGSIGVVLYAYSNGHLDSDEAKTLLHTLERDTTLYLGRPLLNQRFGSSKRKSRTGESQTGHGPRDDVRVRQAGVGLSKRTRGTIRDTACRIDIRSILFH